MKFRRNPKQLIFETQISKQSTLISFLRCRTSLSYSISEGSSTHPQQPKNNSQSFQGSQHSQRLFCNAIFIVSVTPKEQKTSLPGPFLKTWPILTFFCHLDRQICHLFTSAPINRVHIVQECLICCQYSKLGNFDPNFSFSEHLSKLVSFG